MTDEQLLLAFGSTGQESLFVELCRRFQKTIRYACWKLLRDEGLADDAAQDALLSILKKAGTYHGGSRAFTWIWRIAHNAAIDRLRDCRYWRQVALPPFALEWQEKRCDPVRLCQDRELSEIVARLPPIHREILQFIDLDGGTYEEAAAELGICMGTVRSRLHRARELLRELLPADSLNTH
jgi:RNA polymerase sigma-70 factor (ECF subfamily)